MRLACTWCVIAMGCGRIRFDAPDPSELDLTIGRDTASNAAATCAARGAHLATVRDATENARITELAATVPIDPADFPTTNHQRIVWLGARAVDPITDERSWSWDTGEAMTYTNWRPGEPDETDERCMVLLGAEGGLWDNRDCDMAPFAFVCEAD